MPHYKDSTNKLHYLQDAAFANLLPVGSVEITDVEASILLQPTPAQLAEKAAAEAKLADIAQAKADTKADAFVQQFVEMTPAQVIAYVNSNVANLADAKQLLTKMALMMLAIVKEQYK